MVWQFWGRAAEGVLSFTAQGAFFIGAWHGRRQVASEAGPFVDQHRWQATKCTPSRWRQPPCCKRHGAFLGVDQSKFSSARKNYVGITQASTAS